MSHMPLVKDEHLSALGSLKGFCSRETGLEEITELIPVIPARTTQESGWKGQEQKAHLRLVCVQGCECRRTPRLSFFQDKCHLPRCDYEEDCLSGVCSPARPCDLMFSLPLVLLTTEVRVCPRGHRISIAFLPAEDTVENPMVRN